MKRAVVIAGILVLSGIAAALLCAYSLHRYLDRPASISEDGQSFEIAAGTPFSRVTEKLAVEGVIDRPGWLRFYARVTGDASAIKAGQYRLVAGETPRSILEKFVAGDVELYSFTIVEGWNQWELLAALQQADHINASITQEDWPAVLESFGDAGRHPEGLFLPETYRFPRGTSDVDLLHQAYLLMQRTLDQEWQGRAEDLPIDTPYEALILASIIEKETAKADERPQISGVFVRRLENRMRLQTDPTVIYGIGPGFNGNLTRANLTTDTPYNTYTRHGLPPTPIAMPGRDAIHAALHPAEGHTLYFVATGLGDGSHKFSETKAEHDVAVREYLQRLRNNRKRDSEGQGN